MLDAHVHRAVMPELVTGPDVLPMQGRFSSSHPRLGPHTDEGS